LEALHPTPTDIDVVALHVANFRLCDDIVGEEAFGRGEHDARRFATGESLADGSALLSGLEVMPSLVVVFAR
jgi:hypothetical protein